MGSNESGLLQQVVFKCRFYWVDLRMVAVSEQWSLKAGCLLRQAYYHIQMTSTATFYADIHNTRMQRNADIQVTKCIKTLRNVGD